MEISFEDTGNGASASKQFADESWRRWMRLSPDYWRETLGETVGKIWQDARQGENLDCLGWGVNGIYGGTSEQQMGMVGVVEVSGDPVNWVEPKAESVVWRVNKLDELGLRVLEDWVRRGVVSHYGLAGFVAADLMAWVGLSEQVAEEIWGRKKRAGLRCVVVRANVLEMGVFLTPEVDEVRHGKTETLSVAEFAARRGWRIVVEGALAWQVPQVGRVTVTDVLPEETELERAIVLLTHLVEAEDMLNEALGGWPMVEGMPLWRAGALVGQGLPLWPSAEGLAGWQRDVWPMMAGAFKTFERDVESVAALETYRAAVEELLEEGAAVLAMLAEKRLSMAVMDDLRAAMTQAEQARWEGVPDSALAVALMASVPGVCGVLVPAALTERETWMRAIQGRPDIADIGRLLG